MIKIDDCIIEGTCDLHSREVKKLIAMEELGELIQAISKGRRDELTNGFISHEHHKNEMEEVADVLLMCRALMYLDGLDEDIVQAWVDYKQKRQMFRDYITMHKDGIPDEIDKLTTKVYSMFGLTPEIMNGTADEQTMLNYYSRKCKEVYDAYNGDEAKIKNDVPQI